MAKDPAFLFYPNDYLGGTMGMTFEEKGAYIDLLMLQFNRGHMTSHMIGQTVGQIWDKIKDKFIKDENGLYYNVRLEQEQKKRQSYTASRKNNKKGVNQHSKKEEKNIGHMTYHMENENINTISIGIAPEMFKIFKAHNSKYYHDKDKDFSSCLSIAYKIAESKGIEKNDVIKNKKNEILESWEKVVVYCCSDKWFSTRALFDLNNEWQRIVQAMNGKLVEPKIKHSNSAPPLRTADQL